MLCRLFVIIICIVTRMGTCVFSTVCESFVNTSTQKTGEYEDTNSCTCVSVECAAGDTAGMLGSSRLLMKLTRSGGRLNKKDGLTRYGNSHVKDKTS